MARNILNIACYCKNALQLSCFANQQEKDAKATLQAQIQNLREDNQRLLEESYSASTKLKKFTEWVFNTIDMN